jgi:peroxin-6
LTNKTTRFTLSPTLSLSRIASRLPFTYTGADFYALCSDAMLKAVTRQASAVDAKVAMLNNSLSSPPRESNTPLKITPAYFFDHYATKEDIAVMVTEEDFLEAHRELIPSVSAKELEHYGKVRAQFESVPEKEGRSRSGEAKADGSAGPGMPKFSKLQGKGKGKELNGTGITGPGAGNGSGNGNGNAAIPEWQLPHRPKANGRPRGKGKGKVRDWGADIGEEDEEEDELGDGEGFMEDVKVEGPGYGNGNNGFAVGREEDDEGLY